MLIGKEPIPTWFLALLLIACSELRSTPIAGYLGIAARHQIVLSVFLAMIVVLLWLLGRATRRTDDEAPAE